MAGAGELNVSFPSTNRDTYDELVYDGDNLSQIITKLDNYPTMGKRGVWTQTLTYVGANITGISNWVYTEETM